MATVITQAVLQNIDLMVNTAYNEQYSVSSTLFKKFAYDATSVGAGSVYPRMDQIPGFREWIGSRVVNSLSYKTFEIDNRTFESSISIKRDDIEDDKYGILKHAAEFLGQNAAAQPDLLCARLLPLGMSQIGYDGVPFFSANHPDFNSLGQATVNTNLITPTGSDPVGPTWYVLDTRQALRAIIYQERRPYVITPLFDLTNPIVFMDNQFMWGADGRSNAGFGIWQTMCAVTAPLNGKYYEMARNAMTSHHRPDGSPLDIKPTLVMFPSPLTGAARGLFKGVFLDPSLNTSAVPLSNEWINDAEILENQWLNV